MVLESALKDPKRPRIKFKSLLNTFIFLCPAVRRISKSWLTKFGDFLRNFKVYKIFKQGGTDDLIGSLSISTEDLYQISQPPGSQANFLKSSWLLDLRKIRAQ